MGEIVAWIIGWDLILEYALGATTVAIGWSGYAVSLLSDLGIVVPDRYAQSPFAYDPANRVWHLTGALLNVPAMAVIAAISALLIVGVHDSARVNNIIVVIKVAIIVVFVGIGAWFVSLSNWVTAGNPEGAFILVCLGVLALRYTQPQLPRPFKTPAVYVVAPAGPPRRCSSCPGCRSTPGYASSHGWRSASLSMRSTEAATAGLDKQAFARPAHSGEMNVSGRHPVAAGALVRGHRCRVPSPHARGCNRVVADRLPQRAGRRREAL